MDDTQAMAQQNDAEEQNEATLPTGDDTTATTSSASDEATTSTADMSGEAGAELQPTDLIYPDGGTAGNEPPIAESTGASDMPDSTAEETQPDVAEAAAGEVPQEQDWRPADAATERADQVSQPSDDVASSDEDASVAEQASASSQANAAESSDAATAETSDSAISEPAATPSSNGGETMEELMQMYGQQGFRTLKYGEVIEGRIMRVGKDELLVDIGAKSEGIVPSNELSDLSPEEFAEMKPGDEILVSVVNTEDSEGHAVLSLNRARQEKSWRKLQKQFEAGEIINTEVSGFNKGGLLVNLEGVRGFVPSSQVSGLGGSEQAKQADLQAMTGRQIALKIIEINRNRNRLILSERLAVTAQREVMKEQLLSQLKAGDVRHGRVVSIADFGAFVDIGGADGLIHLSELSWSRVSHPSEVLKVGQEVDVYVLGVDEQDRKIALSLKRTQVEPWTDITARYNVGQLVEGTITQLATFGAFARIADGVEGLIHVSELSEGRILHPRDVVKEGDKLTLRIIRIDPQRKRIGLSLKRAVEGASMDDIIAEPGEGGRGPRGERTGGERTGEMRGGDRGPRGERTGGTGERPAGEGVGNSRLERFEQRTQRSGERRDDRRDDRRQREPQMPTSFGGGGGESAMEIALREAIARNAGNENEQTEQEAPQRVPRSAMNTVDVTIDTNTAAEPMTHVGEEAAANADEVEAQAAHDVDEVASEVANTLGTADDTDAGSDMGSDMDTTGSSFGTMGSETATESAGSSFSSASSTTASNSGSGDVTGESFATGGTSSDDVLSNVESNEAEQQSVASIVSDSNAQQQTTYTTQGDNATDNATEESGSGSEAMSQHGEDSTAASFSASEESSTGTGSGDDTSTSNSGSTGSSNAGDADLAWVHGIGPTYNKRLGDAGIRSDADLANASPEHLREIGFDHESDEELQNWIQQAKDKLAG